VTPSTEGLPFPPEPCQVEALGAIMAEHEEHRSTLLVLPTGVGKTYTFAWWLRERRRAGAGRALVVAHRRELIGQAAKTLRSFGLSVEIEMAQQRARRLSLDPSDVVVASVQTLQRKRLESWDPDAFDSVVFDEGHHGTARSYRTIRDWFEAAKVLYVTATPDRADKTGLHNVCDSVAYTYEIRDAVREGYLVTPQIQTVHCSKLDLSDLRVKAGDLAASDLEQAMSVDGVAHQIAAPLVELSAGRSTVLFMPTVAAAQHVADVLAGYVDARQIGVVHGGTEETVRARILSAFDAGEMRYLVNCMVLTEGWDSPRVGCIGIARPSKSRALITQIIGRGLRVIRDKETGEIRSDLKSDCLILDFTGVTGRHKLVNPLDCLAGRDLTDVEAELVEKRPELKEAIQKGDLEQLEAAARAYSEEEEQKALKGRLKAKIFAQAKYSTKGIDPFDVSRLAAGGLDDHQIEKLGAMGVRLEGVRDRGHAEKILEWDSYRERKGLATARQSKLLRRFGLTIHVTKTEANQIISALAGNGWEVPPKIRSKYGV
jgi:superfamily II DNA or RNA helicase